MSGITSIDANVQAHFGFPIARVELSLSCWGATPHFMQKNDYEGLGTLAHLQRPHNKHQRI